MARKITEGYLLFPKSGILSPKVEVAHVVKR